MALMLVAYAGSESYSAKTMKEVAPAPCPEFYADQEFNIGLWGALGFAGHDHDDHRLVGHLAGGGGIDAKYFFRRYFGVGLQGFGLFSLDDDDEDNFIDDDDEFFDDPDDGDDEEAMGAVSATFTLRYPFPCHQFSPYLFTGLGIYFGGEGESDFDFDDIDDIDDIDDLGDDDDGDAEFGGQVGAGVEWRFTPSISAISDFSWHVVNGHNNNFGMVKFGVNFAF